MSSQKSTPLSKLKPNPKNPRKISDEKLAMLKRSLEEFGDLSGIVYNRTTGQVVGGHQRIKALGGPGTVIVTTSYKKPTKTGTVEEGYVLIAGERYSYRAVIWDETREKAANIAANKGAGEWDLNQLSEWMIDLDSMGFDLDLTGFDSQERQELMVPTLNPNFEPGTEGEQGQLDRKKPVVCPNCDCEFIPK